VVGVLMGNKYALYIMDAFPYLFQPQANLPAAYPGIN
jgi:hypothetical protein